MVYPGRPSERHGAEGVGAGESFPPPRSERCVLDKRQPPWRVGADGVFHAPPASGLPGGQGRDDPLLRNALGSRVGDVLTRAAGSALAKKRVGPAASLKNKLTISGGICCSAL